MQIRLTPEQFDAYLARIGVERPATADLDALVAIHRAHAYAFTWECLDCFMGWPNSSDPQAAFGKMVQGGRGGWCYEMNGLLGAALSAAGFQVTRLCGGVRRADLGDLAVGNHLTLRVDLDSAAWLAEAGLGDAIVEPIPLALGDSTQRGFDFSLKAADGGWWRFHNHAFGAAPTFDFRPDGADETALAGAHQFLMGDDNSPFRNNLIIQRHFPDRIEGLRNIMRRTVTPAGVAEKPLESLGEFRDLLGDVFQIDTPDLDGVWNKVRTVGVGTFV